MNGHRFLILSVSLLALTGCSDIFHSTMRPDYSIRVTSTPQGSVATAPECPSWSEETTNPFDNQPLPQYGCAHARNLAEQIENPDDLIEGRTMGKERGVTAVGSVRRYDNNQTRGLVWTGPDVNEVAKTSASSSASSMSGDVTGGTSAGASVPAP
ncbi:MAG: CpaD family pilus assembly lipoprotein [Bdellovibrionales bacterium]|jgi:hypothetical protein